MRSLVFGRLAQAIAWRWIAIARVREDAVGREAGVHVAKVRIGRHVSDLAFPTRSVPAQSELKPEQDADDEYE
jgi:hypothetical protein